MAYPSWWDQVRLNETQREQFLLAATQCSGILEDVVLSAILRFAASTAQVDVAKLAWSEMPSNELTVLLKGTKALDEAIEGLLGPSPTGPNEQVAERWSARWRLFVVYLLFQAFAWEPEGQRLARFAQLAYEAFSFALAGNEAERRFQQQVGACAARYRILAEFEARGVPQPQLEEIIAQFCRHIEMTYVPWRRLRQPAAERRGLIMGELPLTLGRLAGAEADLEAAVLDELRRAIQRELNIMPQRVGDHVVDAERKGRPAPTWTCAADPAHCWRGHGKGHQCPECGSSKVTRTDATFLSDDEFTDLLSVEPDQDRRAELQAMRDLMQRWSDRGARIVKILGGDNPPNTLDDLARELGFTTRTLLNLRNALRRVWFGG
jgi:hypothetical protein